MSADNDIIYKEGNISTGSRIIRAAVALVMLLYPMFIPQSPIDVLALLPIIAIYPMYTAVVGWDPVMFILQSDDNRASYYQSVVARILLILLALVMILIPLTIPDGYVGWYGLTALLSVVPMLVAIMGENPLHALRKSNAVLRDTDVHQDEYTVNGYSQFGLDKNAVNCALESDRHKIAA